MKTLQLPILCLFACLLTACDRNKPVPGIPEKKSSFQKTIFTQPQSGRTISLVSASECEIDNKGNILLAEYSRQDNKLRVVFRSGGAASITYFELFPDGLRDPDSGQVFLLPEPLKIVHEKMRIAQEREDRIKAEQERLRMEEEQRKIAEVRRKQAIIAESREKLLTWFHSNFAKGQQHTGSYGDTDSRYPITLTITEEPKLNSDNSNGPDFQSFKFTGKIHWTDKMPRNVYNEDTVQDHPVSVHAEIRMPEQNGMPEENKYAVDLHFFYYNQASGNYGGFNTSRRVDSKWESNSIIVFDR